MNIVGRLKEMIRSVVVKNKLDYNYLPPNTRDVYVLINHIDVMLEEYGHSILTDDQLDFYFQVVDLGWCN